MMKGKSDKQKKTQLQIQQHVIDDFVFSTCDVNNVEPLNTTQCLTDNNATATVYTTGCQASQGKEGEQPPSSLLPPSIAAKRESSGHRVSEKVEDTAVVDTTAYQASQGEEGEPLALSTPSLSTTKESTTEDPPETVKTLSETSGTASEHLSTKQTSETKQTLSKTKWSGGTQQMPPKVAEGSARTTQSETVFVASETTDSFPIGLGYNFWAMDPDNNNYGSNPQESTASGEIEMIAETEMNGTTAANATMTETNLEPARLKEDEEESHNQMDKMEPEWNRSKTERNLAPSEECRQGLLVLSLTSSRCD